MIVKRILTGLFATISIVVLVIGIPIGLHVAGGSPWPSTTPSVDDITGALTRPDDGRAFFAVLKVVGWVAWFSFAAMVLLEVAARLRGVRPPRIPALSVQQRAAAGLVGAAALLFTAVPLVGTAAAVAAEPAPTVAMQSAAAEVSSELSALRRDAQTETKTQTQTAETAAPASVDHAVRSGDTLWSIAEEHLGDGARFMEIAHLNYDRVQPDGESLTSSHWIQPGWTLKVPTNPTVAPDPDLPEQVIVEPGDSLSQIAQDNLGDANRWPELYDATRKVTQPDGARITDPDLIHPGWTVRLPGAGGHDEHVVPAVTAHFASTHADHTVASTDGGAGPLDSTTRQESTAAEVRSRALAEQELGEALAESAAIANAETTGAGTGEPTLAATGSDEDLAEGEAFPVRTVAGVGSLLAAGVVGLVSARRTRQRRRHVPAQYEALPSGSTAEAEQELRAIADHFSVGAVDLALRSLAAQCAHAGIALPVVRAARLTADQFDLYLAEPAHLPPPWHGTADASVWTLHQRDRWIDPTTLTDVPAPYPSLVTIGHDVEDGHVFLDLEYLGALGIIGEPDHTRQVLAAVAVELATSRWADDLQITLVGAYPELDDLLETGRVRYLPTPGQLLEELQHRADLDRLHLQRVGAQDLQHARAARAARAVSGAWTPEIVLLAGEVSETDRQRLDDLISQVPRVAVAAVTHGHVAGEWTLHLNGLDSASLDPIGLYLRPQILDDATYKHLLSMLVTADSHTEPDTAVVPNPTLADLPLDSVDDGEGVEFSIDLGNDTVVRDLPLVPEPSPGQPQPDPGPKPLSQTDDSSEHPPLSPVTPMPHRNPQILLMGTVEVINASGPVEPSRLSRLTELAAFLVTHPGCDDARVDQAQWPGAPVSDNSRTTAMSKLRRWMGKTPSGDDFLPRFQSEVGYRMHDDVTTDWDQWQRLLPAGVKDASTTALEEALQLVRGRPFGGVRARRYAWAENLRQEMLFAILDATHELAHRRLMDGRWRAAGSAAALGLSIEPAYERLWRIRILAAHASGHPDAVTQAVDGLLATAEAWGGDLDEETETLLASLDDAPPNIEQLAHGIH